MNKHFSVIAGAAALAIAGFVGGSALNGAEAQGAQKAPVILIVDRAQLIAQSKAGKTIPDQANSVKAKVEGELEAEAAKLKKDIDDFNKNQTLMSDEVRKQKGQELEVRRQVTLPQRAQIMEQVFGNAVQQAQAKILIESQPIMKEIVEKRSATILLDRSAVMYAAPETDITQEVLAALDKKMKSVDVQKVSLADVDKAIAEMAKAQAAARAEAQKN